jgi:hypothetical protein
MHNNDSFSIGGRQIAFNPAGPSLFAGARSGKVAEVSIPSPVNSANPNALPFATLLQTFADPMEGRLSQIPGEGTNLDSLLVYGNKLYGTASIYYDANNTQRVSHFSHSLQLNEPSFQGWSAVWDATKTGFVSGIMAVVPNEWRALLGGTAVTGQCCIPIVSRTSWGPAAFAFDPARVGDAMVPASPLLYYNGEHATLGSWTTSNPTYGATTLMGGLAIINGTRTALYFGTNGLGAHCYGTGTSNSSLHLTTAADGELYCYDPTNSDKGSHAYPYRYQMWAYDLNDFAAVKAGTKQPWEVIPYGVWPFDLPTPPQGTVRLGGVAYDPAQQTLYLSQLYADRDGYSYRPVIHALHINVAKAAAPPSPVSALGITSNVAAPQSVGTMIRFSASATGGAAPYEYKWLTYDGAAWTARTGWGTAGEYAWTPTAPNASARVAAWVRSGGNTADSAEATAEMNFPIAGSRVSSVTLTANMTSPQPQGTSVRWTATPTGGAAHQFKWWVHAAGTWAQLGDWTSSSQFDWTPSGAGEYRIAVWSKSAGSTDAYEAANEAYFTVSTAPVATPAPVRAPAPPASTVSTVSIAANLPAPQWANTTITWTAVPTGGVAPHQYQWWVFDGANWSAVTDWMASNQYSWRPAAAHEHYRVAVWVRSAGASGGAEASTEAYFAITPPPPPLSAVQLTANRIAPQPMHTTITWTATPVGGISPHQYQWWVFDGASWSAATGFTTANTFAWTPTVASPFHRVAVWVRSAGNSGAHEAATESYFAVTAAVATAPAPTPPPAPATSVSISANRIAPQPPNTTITWTATPVGGVAPHQYQWWVYDGTTWVSQPWTTSNTFAWRPVTASSSYRIAVWVRSAGATGSSETSTEAYFTIAGAPRP